jgi:hypothetical protein
MIFSGLLWTDPDTPEFMEQFCGRVINLDGSARQFRYGFSEGM